MPWYLVNFNTADPLPVCALCSTCPGWGKGVTNRVKSYQECRWQLLRRRDSTNGHPVVTTAGTGDQDQVDAAREGWGVTATDAAAATSSARATVHDKCKWCFSQWIFSCNYKYSNYCFWWWGSQKSISTWWGVPEGSDNDANIINNDNEGGIGGEWMC